jgi:hypothetical protein
MQLHITYREIVDWTEYSGDLVVDVVSTKTYSNPLLVDIYLDGSIPLTNENIDKITQFFNQFRS